jgi:acyl dehydratase
MTDHVSRSLDLTGELLRAYSRRGNFHSEPDEADRLGLPGLVAQGMQVAAPAYDALLERWGDELLERGVVEMRFVAMVVEDEIVTASVEIDGRTASFEVTSTGTDKVAVIGTATLPDPVSPEAQRGARE